MKKVFLALVVAASFVACDNAGSDTPAKTDSPVVKLDSPVVIKTDSPVVIKTDSPVVIKKDSPVKK